MIFFPAGAVRLLLVQSYCRSLPQMRRAPLLILIRAPPAYVLSCEQHQRMRGYYAKRVSLLTGTITWGTIARAPAQSTTRISTAGSLTSEAGLESLALSYRRTCNSHQGTSQLGTINDAMHISADIVALDRRDDCNSRRRHDLNRRWRAEFWQTLRSCLR